VSFKQVFSTLKSWVSGKEIDLSLPELPKKISDIPITKEVREPKLCDCGHSSYRYVTYRNKKTECLGCYNLEVDSGKRIGKR
jgi:hypothetical protein